uniref:Uncharacterized protein n=1 Tax=Anguilla anguilla TaxID=7936 RepID=A0A0E9WG93_ANGAN
MKTLKSPSLCPISVLMTNLKANIWIFKGAELILFIFGKFIFGTDGSALSYLPTKGIQKSQYTDTSQFKPTRILLN